MATIDPFSGQEVYSPNSFGAEVGIGIAQQAGIDTPLAFRMAENMPGIATSMGFSTFRGTNTIMRGGFLEGEGRLSKRLAGRRAAKYRLMDQSGVVGAKKTSHFIGGRTERGPIGRALGLDPRNNFMTKRASKLMNRADKPGFVRSARVNNMTFRPRAFGRYHSISVFGGDTYTPFGASKMLGKSSRVRSMFEKAGVRSGEKTSILGPGLFSFVGAGRKADILEKRALSQLSSTGEVSKRLLGKLDTVDRNIRGLAGMNNRGLLKGTAKFGYEAAGGLSDDIVFNSKLGKTGGWQVKKGKTFSYYTGGSATEPGTLKTAKAGQRIANDARLPISTRTAPIYDTAMGTAVGTQAGTVGVRGNLMASSAYGAGTQYLAGYFRGAGGFGAVEGLSGNALKGATAAEARFGRAFATAFGDEAITMRSGRIVQGADEAIKFLQSTGGKSFFREIGSKGIGKLATSGGGRMLAARAGMLAIPGLNVVAAAMMAYDLGQMAGEVVKSGINLAKDANKSLKGSIAKPLFGMGYQDTEAAATSRSRGVMAIQNSQLNARSALGHEASMMAAHFG
jgi:hypothetical protein